MTVTYVISGINLMMAMNAAGIDSEKELAEISGIDRCAVDRYICGTSQVSKEKLHKLAKALNTKPEKLLVDPLSVQWNPRVEVRMSPANHAFIKSMAMETGLNMSQCVDLVVKQYQKDHPAMYGANQPEMLKEAVSVRCILSENKLRKAMKDAGIDTLAELARRSGCSETSMNRYARALREISIVRLKRVAEVLGVKPDDLTDELGGTSETD